MTAHNLQTDLQNEIIIYKGIICAVDIHCKAIELVYIYPIIFANNIRFIKYIINDILVLKDSQNS